MNTPDKNTIEEFLSDAWKNYLFNSKWLPIANTNGGFIGTKADSDEIMTQEIFINRIKIDSEFANKWGVRVETRELSNEEIAFEANKRGFNLKGMTFSGKLLIDPKEVKEKNLPTKLITITYNDKTIEVYE